MDLFRLAGSCKFPITPYNPHYDERWMFEPSHSSFFSALGTGLLKSVLECPHQAHESRLLKEINVIPADELNDSDLIEGSKGVFMNLLKSIKGPKNPSEKLAKLYSHLANTRRPDILYAIFLVTRALFVSADLAQGEYTLENDAPAPEDSLLRMICQDLDINVHILSNRGHKKIEVKKNGPLITLYAENDNYSLMFKSHNNRSDFSAFPYILQNRQEENDNENNEQVIRLLLTGFNPSIITDDRLHALSTLAKSVLSDQNLTETIQDEINNSATKQETFVPLCGQKHLLKELVATCKIQQYKCPCDKKLSRKNIDDILGKKRNRNSLNSIKNKAHLSAPHLDESTNKTLNLENDSESSLKHIEEVCKFNCKNRSQDPIKCSGHSICIDCRYTHLNSDYKCPSCERVYSRKERKSILASLIKGKEYPIRFCENCQMNSYLPEHNLCVTCVRKNKSNKN